MGFDEFVLWTERGVSRDARDLVGISRGALVEKGSVSRVLRCGS